MTIIGIDPGLNGGIAFMTAFGGCAVHSLPIIRDGKLSWIDGTELSALIRDETPSTDQKCTAYIERAQAFPGMGGSGAFNYGVGFGSILAVLQVRGIAIHLVPPATWKRALGLSRDKNASLDKARLFYPDLDLHRQKDEGRAEAVLIAHWARTKG